MAGSVFSGVRGGVKSRAPVLCLIVQSQELGQSQRLRRSLPICAGPVRFAGASMSISKGWKASHNHLVYSVFS